jgi:hypothetical protein
MRHISVQITVHPMVSFYPDSLRRTARLVPPQPTPSPIMMGLPEVVNPPVTLLLNTLTSPRAAWHGITCTHYIIDAAIPIAVRRFHCTRVRLQLSMAEAPRSLALDAHALSETLELRASLGTSINLTGLRYSMQKIPQWIDYRRKSLMAGRSSNRPLISD